MSSLMDKAKEALWLKTIQEEANYLRGWVYTHGFEFVRFLAHPHTAHFLVAIDGEEVAPCDVIKAGHIGAEFIDPCVGTLVVAGVTSQKEQEALAAAQNNTTSTPDPKPTESDGEG